MRDRLALTALLVAGPLLGEEFQWERVYPDEYPVKEELPILSLGVQFQSAIPKYLVGSRDGYVIAGLPFSNITNNYYPPATADDLSWTVIKLPVDYDITAITGFQFRASNSTGNWVIGGPRGQVDQIADVSTRPLYSGEFNPEWGPVEFLNTENVFSWFDPDSIPMPIDTEATVLALEGTNQHLLALAGDALYAKSRSSWFLPWTTIERPFPVLDLEAFDGFFYILEKDDELWSTQLTLKRSSDGLEWSTVWSLETGTGFQGADIFTLTDSFQLSGLPSKDMGRLYVNFKYVSGNENVLLGFVSTRDGEIWMDHGSHFYSKAMHAAQRLLQPWNPLELDDGLVGFGQPALQTGITAADLALRGELGAVWSEPTIGSYPFNTLEQYAFGAWRRIYTTNASPRISADSISGEATLTFLYYDDSYYPGINDDYRTYNLKNSLKAHLVSINAEGIRVNIEFPRINAEFVEWSAFTGFNGHWYAMARVTEVNEQGHGYSAQLYWTPTDRLNWEPVGYPRNTRPISFLSAGSRLLTVHSNGYYVFEDSWSPYYKVPGNYRSLDFTYRSTDDGIYVLLERYADNVIQHMSSTGEVIETHPFEEAVPGTDLFTQLACPDGDELVAFGAGPLIALQRGGPSFETIDLTPYFEGAEPEITGIGFVDGWFYLLGAETLRTRDFIEFQPYMTPAGEPFTHLLAWNGAVYGFSRGGVYRLSSDSGYLDSVEQTSGWRYSPWLGTFNIIDEDLGDIDHLLLGACWVKQTSELEYWIRTEPLGWIYMRKDWSPWLYRLDDRHWYWLDQDSWPGRAWDDTAKVWVALRH